jgi:lipoprotein NlpD
MTRIALDNGQPWKDVARWNSIDNPNQIEVGQVLRVVPPVAVAAVSPTGVVTRPVTSSGTAPLPTSPASSAAAAKPSPEASATGDDRVDWSWPVNGPVLAGFDEVKNKGLDLGGAAGESVLAAADGKVVYVGEGLRGYGKLIILKHNNTYLTAYAHNQALLVKEDQSVRKGQKIAEMGSSDTDRVKLHFEVRRQGKPVDPAKFLPAR